MTSIKKSLPISIMTGAMLLMTGGTISAQEANFLLPVGSFIGETQFEATLEDGNGCSLYDANPLDWMTNCEVPAITLLDFEFQSENQINLLILDVNKEITKPVQRDSFAVAQFDLRNPILTISPDLRVNPRTIDVPTDDTAMLENQESNPNFKFNFSDTYGFVN